MNAQAADPAAPGPAVDDGGWLVDPDNWSEAWAERTAGALGIALQDEHWFVIRFMREQPHEHQVTPDPRHAMRHLELRHPGRGHQRLFELFPYGSVAQCCRIAGMRRPRAWSTG